MRYWLTPRGQGSSLHEGPVNTRSAHDVPFTRRGRDARLHHPDLGRLDRPRSDALAMACLEQVPTGGIQSHRGHLGSFTMQMLIVGIGALGGTIAARALRAGLPVRLA